MADYRWCMYFAPENHILLSCRRFQSRGREVKTKCGIIYLCRVWRESATMPSLVHFVRSKLQADNEGKSVIGRASAASKEMFNEDYYWPDDRRQTWRPNKRPEMSGTNKTSEGRQYLKWRLECISQWLGISEVKKLWLGIVSIVSTRLGLVARACSVCLAGKTNKHANKQINSFCAWWCLHTCT